MKADHKALRGVGHNGRTGGFSLGRHFEFSAISLLPRPPALRCQHHRARPTMSADLFAEFAATPNSASGSAPQQKPTQQPGSGPGVSYSFFDDFNQPPATASQPQQPAFPVATSTAQQNADDDDWGDFEGGTSSFETGPSVNQDPFASSTPVASYASPPAWQAPAQSNVSFQRI